MAGYIMSIGDKEYWDDFRNQGKNKKEATLHV